MDHASVGGVVVVIALDVVVLEPLQTRAAQVYSSLNGSDWLSAMGRGVETVGVSP